MKGITKVGSAPGLRQGIREAKEETSIRVSEEARERIREAEDAKADLYHRAANLRMDGRQA